MKHKDLCKRVFITNKDSMYYGEWGTVIYVDSDYFYGIAIADDVNNVPEFTRDEIRIPRNQRYYSKV